MEYSANRLRGTAMGSPCAPTFAIVFLGWWEDAIVFREEENRWTSLITFWGRFINDILILWTGNRGQFVEFIGELNINNIGLKFTYEIHEESINFLDLMITKKSLVYQSQGKLYVREYKLGTSGIDFLKEDTP